MASCRPLYRNPLTSSPFSQFPKALQPLLVEEREVSEPNLGTVVIHLSSDYLCVDPLHLEFPHPILRKTLEA